MTDVAVTIDLVGCARCHGEGHPGLEFKPLQHPVTFSVGTPPPGPVVLTHWAPCPTNGEPILMAVMDLESAHRMAGLPGIA